MQAKENEMKQKPGLGAFYAIWRGSILGLFFSTLDSHGKQTMGAITIFHELQPIK